MSNPQSIEGAARVPKPAQELAAFAAGLTRDAVPERALDLDAVMAKFMASAALAVPQDRADRIAEAVLALDRHPVADLAAALRSDG